MSEIGGVPPREAIEELLRMHYPAWEAEMNIVLPDNCVFHSNTIGWLNELLHDRTSVADTEEGKDNHLRIYYGLEGEYLSEATHDAYEVAGDILEWFDLPDAVLSGEVSVKPYPTPAKISDDDFEEIPSNVIQFPRPAALSSTGGDGTEGAG